MSDPPYLKEPLHAFVRRYLAATGRPVAEERPKFFRAVAADGAAWSFTYSPATAEAMSAERVALLAAGGRTLDRMLHDAAQQGLALRGRSLQPLPVASTATGCGAFPVCRTLPTAKRCGACPEGHGVRLRVPDGTKVEGGAVQGRALSLRFVFELDVRGPETLREIAVIEVRDHGSVNVLEAPAWDDLASFIADPNLLVPPETYDRLVAIARAMAGELLQPAVAMAAEHAAGLVGPSLRNVRGRAEAERWKAPSESKAIEAHLRREEKALLERQAVYATTRLVNVLALETPLVAVSIRLGNQRRTLTGDITCETCGERMSEAILDRSLHLACPECMDQCFVCGATRCRSCAVELEPCGVCGMRPCADCATNCHDCDARVCLPDVEPCASCGVPSCYGCFEECSRDHNVLCLADAVTCVGTEVLCRSHLVPTSDVKDACDAHSGTCGSCGKTFSDLGLSKTVSGDRVCPADRGPCAKCPDGSCHFATQLSSCSVGGELLCKTKHALACSEGDLACRGHSTTCDLGHRVCLKHAVSCDLGTESMCLPHIAACGVCAKAVCSTHSQACAACGRTTCTDEALNTCVICRQTSCSLCRSEDRCGTCAALRPVTAGETLPPVVATHLDPRHQMLVSLGARRTVAIELGRLRSHILVVEDGAAQPVRPIGFFERRTLGL